MHAAGGIGDNKIPAARSGRFNRIIDYRRRIAPMLMGNYPHAKPFSVYFKLINSRRAEGIRRGEYGPAFFRIAAVPGKFGGRRGFSHPVYPQKDNDRESRRQRHPRRRTKLRFKQKGEFFPQRRRIGNAFPFTLFPEAFRGFIRRRGSEIPFHKKIGKAVKKFFR
jgi:hypothetical protein